MDYNIGDEFLIQTIGDVYYTRITHYLGEGKYQVIDLDTMVLRRVIGVHELVTGRDRTVRYLGYKNTKLGKILYGSK